MTRRDGEVSPPFEITEPAAWRGPISFNSPYFSVVPNTVQSQEYDQISVVSFDVRIAPRTPKGDYSIAVSSAGDRAYIAGGLSIESFANTLSSTQFFDE